MASKWTGPVSPASSLLTSLGRHDTAEGGSGHERNCSGRDQSSGRPASVEGVASDGSFVVLVRLTISQTATATATGIPGMMAIIASVTSASRRLPPIPNIHLPDEIDVAAS
jgi:hypothetical protein